jgi:hypothetical protein
MNANRLPPTLPHSTGTNVIRHKGSVKSVATAGNVVVTAQQCIRCWSLSDGGQTRQVPHFETKITAMSLIPTKLLELEGKFVWVGLEQGELLAIDITTCQVYGSKMAHNSAIRHILRHKGAVYTIDDKGNAAIWNHYDSQKKLVFDGTPVSFRLIPKVVSCAISGSGELWCSNGIDKAIEVFHPSFSPKTLSYDGIFVGSLITITLSADETYMFTGHDDGTIVVWTTKDYVKTTVYKISSYKITSLVSVSPTQLWVGMSTGKILIFDITSQFSQFGGIDASMSSTGRWKMLKIWDTEAGSIQSLSVDILSLYQTGKLEVTSCGDSGMIQMWDGLLTNDWIGKRQYSILSPPYCCLDHQLRLKENEYSDYEELTIFIGSWNIDARKPKALALKPENSNFVNEWLSSVASPDIVVIGFQEIVDLESKKMNASND